MTDLGGHRSSAKVAVVEGWHPFDAPKWIKLWNSLEGIEAYPQVIENWAVDVGACRKDYDAVVFYNMNMQMEGMAFREHVEKAIEELGETEQGIVMLHHAILAFPEEKVWSDICGMQQRSFGYHPDQRYTIQVANRDHPITRGTDDWHLHDETYTMGQPEPPENDILLTTEYDTSMKVVGWTRTHKSSRVFCFQPGHDNTTWDDPRFREHLRRGILWSARRL